MSMTNKLALAKRRSGLTCQELSRRSGVPLSTVNKILSGQTRHPSPQSLERLCRVLGISMRYLLDDAVPEELYVAVQCENEGLRFLSSQQWEMVRDYGVLTVQGRQMVDALLALLTALSPLPLPTGRRRLLLGFQPAAQGQRGPLMDGFHAYALDVPADGVTNGADFAFLLTDRSMIPVYLPGTMLAVKRTPATHNQLGLFLLNREIFVRKLRRTSGRSKLVALNVEFKDLPIQPEDQLSCLGTVLGTIRDYVKLPRSSLGDVGDAADFLYPPGRKL